MSAPPRALFHFTCGDHGHAALGDAGTLQPRAHPLLPELGPLVWLTADDKPERDDVGLSSELLTCDRMEYRYRVCSASECLPWSALRSKVGVDVLQALESFGKPETWFVSRRPIRARLVPVLSLSQPS